MARSAPVTLAVTMGDPAGIGPDIILAVWQQRQMLSLPPFVVFGDPGVFAPRAQMLGLDVSIRRVSWPMRETDLGTALRVVDTGSAGEVAPARSTKQAAKATISAIDAGTAAVMAGQASALVTTPISKSALYAAGFRFPGHTEYLAHLARLARPGRELMPVMMLACDELKVVPATIHIPLASVPAALTAGLLTNTITITHAALKGDFAIPAPRIAVAGLNPHAGEQGAIGTEDRDLIAPVVAALAASGMRVTGPHPADTLFHPEARKGYDAVIGMYHDQALIPIKTLAFDRGVNVTLGLPFVRTSPDHGTAYGIAGTGRANPASLIEAMRTAAKMAETRRAHQTGPS